MVTLLTILEDVIAAEFGASTLAAVHALDPHHAERVARATTVEDVSRLMSELAIVRDSTPPKMYYWAGELAAPILLKKLPEITRAYNSMRPLMLHLNGIPAMRAHTLLPEAEMPYFDIEFMSADVVRVLFDGTLESRAALEGLLMGCAKVFGERIEVRPVTNEARPDRRIIDVKLEPERRAVSRTDAPGKRTNTPTR